MFKNKNSNPNLLRGKGSNGFQKQYSATLPFYAARDISEHNDKFYDTITDISVFPVPVSPLL